MLDHALYSAVAFSGTVRRAFAALGHDAWSCDLLPAEDRSNKHIVGDVRDILDDGWDLLMVAHPPCTRLCRSGRRWLSGAGDMTPPKKLPIGRTWESMKEEFADGLDLFVSCWNAPIERVAIENPEMHDIARRRMPADLPRPQMVQPFWFGHPEYKATGLYLRGLSPLVETNRLDELLILAPTIEVAQNSFKPAAAMVRAEPELEELLHVQDHLRTITHRVTKAALKVVAADTDTVSGKKSGRILIDELWVFGKRPHADAMLREATGGLVSRPEGFVIYLSTQSDAPPAGVFKAKLVGIDGGGLDDLFGLSILGREPTEIEIQEEIDGQPIMRKMKRWLSWSHAWCHVGVLERRKSIATRLRAIEAKGELTILNNPLGDVASIIEHITRIKDMGLLGGVAVDASGLGEMEDALDEIGVTQEAGLLVAAPQGGWMMSSIKGAERRLASGLLKHCGGPLMDWCVPNLKIEPTATGIRATKQSAGDAKIDPAMAMFNAVTLMARNPAAPKSAEYQMIII